MRTPSPVPAPRENRLVLIVEDEPVLRSSVQRALSKLPSIEVEGAGTLHDARQLIAADPPDLLLLDLDLPDGNGIELATELRRAGLRTQIIFISGVAREYRNQIRGVELLEKPVPTERLRRLVSERLGTSPSAPPSPFSVTDYLQLASMGRRSVALEVHGPSGEEGTILLRDGELWFAKDKLRTGLEAFRSLALMNKAQVHCRTTKPGDFGERNIEGAAEAVLLDVARDQDEALRHSGVFEALAEEELDVEVEVEFDEPHGGQDEALPAFTFDERYEQGVEALLAKDYRRAWDAFSAAAALRPSDPRVLANLQRLRALGHAP